MKPQPVATIQIDIDSYRAISEAYGRSGSTEGGADQVIQHAVPVYLSLLAEFQLKATFFVIGQDLENEANLPFFESIVAAGHEIANHTYTHTGFAGMTKVQQREEIQRCQDTVARRLKVQCLGFKAPCYAIDEQSLQILNELGLSYDSSMISTLLSPVMKFYYRWVLKRRIESTIFGRIQHLLSSAAPYYPDPAALWRPGENTTLEVPVSTLPYLCLPIHFSFLCVLGRLPFTLFKYLRRLRQTDFLNFAFHAIDLVPEGVLPEKAYRRPGLSRSFAFRLRMAREVLSWISSNYLVIPTHQITNEKGLL